ncbi:MAG: hypothetical protein ABI564_04665 [Ideonella sp.]
MNIDKKSALTRRQLAALLGSFGLAAESLAQDPARSNPRSYSVVFENDRIRVLEYLSRPGLGVCGQGVHSHPAHLNIAMTPIKAKVTLPDGKVIIAQNQAGDVFWEEAGTHQVENIGGSNARAYMVELKPGPTPGRG